MRVINLFKMDTATPAIFMDSINCFINPSVYLNTFHAIHKNILILNQTIHQKNHPFPLSLVSDKTTITQNEDIKVLCKIRQTLTCLCTIQFTLQEKVSFLPHMILFDFSFLTFIFYLYLVFDSVDKTSLQIDLNSKIVFCILQFHLNSSFMSL